MKEDGRASRRTRMNDEADLIFLSHAGADGGTAVPGGAGGERDCRQGQGLGVHHARPRPRRRRRGRQRLRRGQRKIWVPGGGSCAQDRPVLKRGARDLPQCPRRHDALGPLRHALYAPERRSSTPSVRIFSRSSAGSASTRAAASSKRARTTVRSIPTASSPTITASSATASSGTSRP